MTKKRLNLAILLSFVIIFTLSFTACSQNSNEEENAGEETKNTETEGTEAENTDSQSQEAEDSKETKELQKIQIILDWVPNTNHTGLYSAKELGYFEDAGFDVQIVQPPEGSTSQLVGSGGDAKLGIAYQEYLAQTYASNAPIPVTAVAAILQHNTSGILSLKETGIDSPKKMEGKKYSTYDIPVELAMLKKMMANDGGDFDKVELVPFGTDTVTALNTDSDSVWVYYGWDGIKCEIENIETNYLAYKDYVSEADFYSPVIIANNQWLEENPEDAKAVIEAICKGYEYAVENPKEAAKHLLKNAPEIDEKLAYASQEWLSKEYISDAKQFGYIDPARWNSVYKWFYEEKLIEREIPENFGFTNEFLPER